MEGMRCQASSSPQNPCRATEGAITTLSSQSQADVMLAKCKPAQL